MSEQRLQGVRVLVTRPRARAEELFFLLEDEGAEVLELPLLELHPPEDDRPLRSAAEQVHRYRWVLFTSAHGVSAFMEAVREAGTLQRLRQARLGAVGPATARTLKAHGLDVAVEADTSTGPGLFSALAGQLQPDDEVLLPVAQDGRPELYDALVSAGLRVTRVTAYRGVAEPPEPSALEALKAQPPHLVLFASPRAVEVFLDVTGDWGTALLRTGRAVAIGPTTAGRLAELGLSAGAVAARPAASEWVDAAIQAAAAQPAAGLSSH